MCRFVVYRGPDVALRNVVFGGSHSLVEQAYDPRELLVGHTNADGYGVVWYRGANPVRIARREPIWYDPDLERLLDTIRSGTVVASLRNATPGMSIGAGGLAPLLVDEWSFALNGYVTGFHDGIKRKIHESLSAPVYRHLRDGSDTEALFLLALQAMRDGTDAAGALTHVIRVIRELVAERARATEAERAGIAQLNMILSNAETTAVSRASSVEATNSLYRASYRDSDTGLLPGGVIVASEALDGDEAWERIEPQSILAIRADGSEETISVPL